MTDDAHLCVRCTVLHALDDALDDLDAVETSALMEAACDGVADWLDEYISELQRLVEEDWGDSRQAKLVLQGAEMMAENFIGHLKAHPA